MDQSIFTDRNGYALRGHDPVAYFTEGAPTQGDPTIRRSWAGAIWLFASEANRDMFDADPTRFAPAFGGHCAVAKAMGLNLPGSPKRWRIENDRLFVNKNLLAEKQHRFFARRIRRLADAHAA